MKPALEHYKKMDMKFDCVYSGFLASSEKIDHCLEFFEAFPDALKVVDPVMGDGGKAYKTYTKELCSRMVELVKVADKSRLTSQRRLYFLARNIPVIKPCTLKLFVAYLKAVRLHKMQCRTCHCTSP